MAATLQLLLALLVCGTTLLHPGAGQTQEDLIKAAVGKMEDAYLKPVMGMKAAMKKRERSFSFTPAAYRRWWPDRKQCIYQDNAFCRAFSSDDSACSLAPQLCPCGKTGRVDCTSTWRVCREAQPYCHSTKKFRGMKYQYVCSYYKNQCPCGNTKSVVCKHLRFQRKNKPKKKINGNHTTRPAVDVDPIVVHKFNGNTGGAPKRPVERHQQAERRVANPETKPTIKVKPQANIDMAYMHKLTENRIGRPMVARGEESKEGEPMIQRERRLPNPMEKPKVELEPLPHFDIESLHLEKPLASSFTEQHDDSAVEEDMEDGEDRGQSSEEDHAISEEDHVSSEEDLASSEEDHASSEEDHASSEEHNASSEEDLASSEEHNANSEEDLTVSTRNLTTMVKRGGLDRSRVGQTAAYRNKQKPARTQMLLDVMPWDDETDMGELEMLVRAVQRDGLVWGKSRLVPVAYGYGIKKLQISCAVEADKVSTEWLKEQMPQIEGLKDSVQRVDVVSDYKQNGDEASTRFAVPWWWFG